MPLPTLALLWPPLLLLLLLLLEGAGAADPALHADPAALHAGGEAPGQGGSSPAWALHRALGEAVRDIGRGGADVRAALRGVTQTSKLAIDKPRWGAQTKEVRAPGAIGILRACLGSSAALLGEGTTGWEGAAAAAAAAATSNTSRRTLHAVDSAWQWARVGESSPELISSVQNTLAELLKLDPPPQTSFPVIRRAIMARILASYLDAIKYAPSILGRCICLPLYVCV
jgi:hypothetical protein